MRNVQSVGGEAAATEHEYEGRVSELTDGSPSTEIGTGRYAGGWSDGPAHGTGTMEWIMVSLSRVSGYRASFMVGALSYTLVAVGTRRVEAR